ncbi:MAG: hypothetical protein ACRBB0_09170 [Pelagimonas sp.]|uniref:hypothetical protein n=1 Tax=Pelagimonas sp. TaxID=2073170 RepID=UPI003D6C314C
MQKPRSHRLRGEFGSKMGAGQSGKNPKAAASAKTVPNAIMRAGKDICKSSNQKHLGLRQDKHTE